MPIGDEDKITFGSYDYENFKDLIIKRLDDQDQNFNNFSKDLIRDFQEFKKDIEHKTEITSKDIEIQRENLNEFKKDYKDDQKDKVSRKTMIWSIIATLIAGLIGGSFLKEIIIYLIELLK